jgi:predicted dehydrogenase
VTQPLTVSVAGIGNAGAEHLRAFAADPAAEIHSIVDLDTDRAAALCDDLAITCPIHTDIGTALSDPDLDAIVIATPNPLHPAMTIAAAQASKHILLEKPAALDEPALAQMVDAVDKAGVLCQVNMILRWHPMIESIVKLRDGGVLGEVHTVEADFIFGELEGAEPDWARSVSDGGSLHLYAGCHAYDQLEWLMGDRVASVSAVSGRHSAAWEYDVTACAVVEFSRGGLGRVTVTLEAAAPYQFNIRVFGSNGTVVNNTVCVPTDHGGDFVSHCDQRVDVTYLPFDRVAADFIANVSDGRESHAALNRTADLFRLAIDADKAAATRTVVRR